MTMLRAITTPRRLAPLRRRPHEVPTLIERIRDSVIGDDAVLEGPFGPRRMVYADATASGRSLTFVEDFIRDQVLPLYGNTHTEASATGRRTTALREEARGHHPPGGQRRRRRRRPLLRLRSDRRDRQADPAARAAIAERAAGRVHRPLRAPLQRAAVARVDRRGRTDPRGRRRPRRPRSPRARAAPPRRPAAEDRQLLRRVERDRDRHRRRRGRDRAASARRAVVLGLRGRRPVSPDRHERRAGDPRRARSPTRTRSSSRRTSSSAAPGRPACSSSSARCCATAFRRSRAAGPILFVSPTRHSYHPEPAIREEGGTPAIVESIRAGLAFALKEAVGSEEIRRREHDFARRALRIVGARTRRSRSSATPSSSASRSSRSACATRRGLLHANFVVAVLSDLFGIQARSGCFCAGPVHPPACTRSTTQWSARMDAEVGEGSPGRQARVHPRSASTTSSARRSFAYVVDAVHLLAREGWKLLPLYRFDPDSGLWHHRAGTPAPADSLARRARTTRPPRFATAPESVLAGQLEAARRIIAAVQAGPPASTTRRSRR